MRTVLVLTEVDGSLSLGSIRNTCTGSFNCEIYIILKHLCIAQSISVIY